MAELKITKDNFTAEVLESDIPVLVDFWATWCGPCMMLAPTIEELAEELDGKAKICKVNVDEEAELANMFRIQSSPTVMIFKHGEVTDMVVGLRPKDVYLEKLQ